MGGAEKTLARLLETTLAMAPLWALTGGTDVRADGKLTTTTARCAPPRAGTI